MSEHRGTLPPGYEIEGYRIERVLGQGGFGVTYLAHDQRLDRQVAIKEYLPCQFAVREADSTIVPRSTADHEEFRHYLGRFTDEARTLAKFRHPNIVRVLGLFEALGTAYMIMEYERGESLGNILRARKTPTDSAWICGWLQPLLDGLAAVHAAHFLHRDIKPDNIFVRSDGTPLLLDFGAARSIVGAAQMTSLISAGYAPLEQYAPDGKQGPWSDIYGMAAVLYCVISGKPPAAAPLRSPVDPLVPAAQLGGGCHDPRLLGPIDWALRLDERARPQSVGEWRRGRDGIAGLDAVLCPEVTTVVPAEADTSARTTRVAPVAQNGGAHRRHVQTMLAVSVAALVLAGGAFALLGRSPAPSHRVPTESTPGTSHTAPGNDGRDPTPEFLDEGLTLDGSASAISALGMVDASDTRYQTDPDLMMVDLRSDARRQVIEKAVGIFVARGALLEHYDALANELFGRGELVDRLVDDARPRRNDDGLVYLPAAAEVRLQDVRKLLFRLSREQRLVLIRAQGDPLISVAVSLRDAERGSPIERSALAENVIKQRIRDFGFRVASPSDGGPGPRPDFAIESEAKLKTLRYTLPASGLTIAKYVLTSWTVKCTERESGEDIYFDNRVPDSGSWADEDRALEAIGKLIANEFSQDFFAEHLPRVSRDSRLVIRGLPSGAAVLLRRELVGLRSVVRVVASAPAAETATFDVRWYDQGPGGEQSFDGTVLAPLRRKLGRDCLVADAAGGRDVVVSLAADCAPALASKLGTIPAAGLTDAPAERLAALARSVATMQKLALLNPGAVSTLAARGSALARDALAAKGGKVDL